MERLLSTINETPTVKFYTYSSADAFSSLSFVLLAIISLLLRLSPLLFPASLPLQAVGVVLIADPSAAEEACMDGTLTFSINAHRYRVYRTTLDCLFVCLSVCLFVCSSV